MKVELPKKIKRGSRAVLSALAVVASAFAPSAPAAALEPADTQVYWPTSDWQTKPHGTWVKVSEVHRSLLTSFSKAGYNREFRAWRLAYTSSAPDADLVATRPGRPLLATGILLVPTGVAWTKSPTRPVVVFAPKTQGIGSECAPSKALEFGREEVSEVQRIITALDAGYVVAITDYDGYTVGAQAHHYLVGQSLGHAVLDMALATQQYLTALAAAIEPAQKISPNAPMAIWGYSEGGMAAAWAGQLVSTYAPSLLSTLRAVASGGPVTDTQDAAVTLDSSPGSGMLLSGVWGYHNAYPRPFSQGGIYFDINDTFKRDLLGDNAAVKYQQNPPTTDQPGALLYPATCVDQLGPQALKSMVYRNNGLAGYNWGLPFRISQLTSMPELRWEAVMRANNPGGMRIPVPFYFYHGSFSTTLNSDGSAKEGDGILSANSFNTFFTRMCANGTDVWRQVVLSTSWGNTNHETASDKAFADVVGWLDKALTGQALSFTSSTWVNGVSTTRRCGP